jgi:hypothetical protein
MGDDRLGTTDGLKSVRGGKTRTRLEKSVRRIQATFSLACVCCRWYALSLGNIVLAVAISGLVFTTLVPQILCHAKSLYLLACRKRGVVMSLVVSWSNEAQPSGRRSIIILVRNGN